MFTGSWKGREDKEREAEGEGRGRKDAEDRIWTSFSLGLEVWTECTSSHSGYGDKIISTVVTSGWQPDGNR